MLTAFICSEVTNLGEHLMIGTLARRVGLTIAAGVLLGAAGTGTAAAATTENIT